MSDRTELEQANQEHTPGPWDREGATVFALDETRSVNRFSVTPQGGYVCRQQGWDEAVRTSESELQANAHRISAVPEMYEVLEEFECSLDLLERNGPDLTCADGEFVAAGVLQDRAEKLRAALRKARGEQP